MRLLWIATKPPVPPIDGGRLVAWTTLQALAEAGVEITLVAPLPPGEDAAAIEGELAAVCHPRLVRTAPRGRVPALLRSVLGARPYAVVRHTLPAVAREVERLVASERFDAVHAEQLHAFAQAEPALRAGLPVVLRAQNVESDLWRAAAGLHDLLPPGAGPWLAREARRLARYEGQAVRRAAATIALSERDAERLRELAGPSLRGRAHVVTIPPPFPAELPPADHELPGDPPLVLLGSGGWLPNRDGTRWFLEEVWPEVHARIPGAVLHLYAAERERPKRLPEGVHPHPPPADSRDAFAPNAILVVPLRIASGVRMKILEAWARGVPVVATQEAAEGLAAADEAELLLARDSRSFAAAVGQFGPGHALGAELRAGGRDLLRRRFDRDRVAGELLRLYGGVTRPAGSRSPR